MAQKYSIYDHIVSTKGQTIFHTSKPYFSGTLLVYVNGLLADLGVTEDYVEVDNLTIQFNYELSEIDEVIITSSYSSNNMSVEVVSNNNHNPNSLYKKYSTLIKLKNNSKYTVNISLNNQNINWSFTSKYSPLFCSIEKIRLDTGDLLNGATDEQIYYMLYANSKEVTELVRVKTGITGGVVGNYATTIDPTTYTKAWVRYKTDLDLVNSIYLSLSGVSGTTTKKIGPIDVERNVTMPSLKDMLARFKDLFKLQDEYIRNTTLPVQPFVKAKGTTYSGRGVF